MQNAQAPTDIISTFNLISFIASLASLILAIVAIWITLHFKRESDRVNKETRDLLMEIRTDAKVVSQVAMPELRAYGELSRQVIGRVGNMRIDSLSVAQENERAKEPQSG